MNCSNIWKTQELNQKCMYILRMLVEQEIIPLLSIFDFPERRAFKKTKKKLKFSFVIFDKGSFSIYEDVVCWYLFEFFLIFHLWLCSRWCMNMLGTSYSRSSQQFSYLLPLLQFVATADGRKRSALIPHFPLVRMTKHSFRPALPWVSILHFVKDENQ